jgi:phospholipid-translocating ATPase
MLFVLYYAAANTQFRFIETHSKTLTNGIAIFCSVGGWFLWNIILSATYNPASTIYYVRSTFLTGFGASLTWWLVLIIILLAIVTLELAAKALLAAFLPTDEDAFQILEKDPQVKRRFEQAASEELQQGWDRKTNKSRDEEEKVREVVEGMQKAEEERRENEVKMLLQSRVEAVDEDARPEGSGQAADRALVDVDGTLSKGYGKVRRD